MSGLGHNQTTRYAKSESHLQDALDVIPLGAQTFSKSYIQFPRGAAPFFIAHGKGAHVTDVDGNEYVDFVNGLLAVSLGLCDQDVDGAVRKQMDEGIIFTLSHPLELEVARKLVDMVPCAEMVRFGKNGSDATSGAIRLARAHTGRDRIAVCGYHGWHDWYVASTTRDLGVPKATRELTLTFAYNDIDSLKALFAKHPGEFAAVILEPMNVASPKEGFLQELCDITRAEGAVVVFDEVVTGFRFANGGAQEYFGVTPDLCTLGKGLANGYPLSALAGKAEIMKRMEDVFYSFTMGGETLSLAAASAVLDKLKREPVVETMHKTGESVIAGVRDAIARHGVGDFVSITGHPVWSFLVLQEAGGCSMWDIKSLWSQECLRRGLISSGTHNICYAHTQADVDFLIGVYDEVFPILRRAIDAGDVRSMLIGEPVKPVFKIR